MFFNLKAVGRGVLLFGELYLKGDMSIYIALANPWNNFNLQIASTQFLFFRQLCK